MHFLVRIYAYYTYFNIVTIHDRNTKYALAFPPIASRINIILKIICAVIKIYCLNVIFLQWFL